MTVRDNGGSGIHFGSPRPITGSHSNAVMNVLSHDNGFERLRNGFDISWPNPSGAIFINCVSKNNFRNFDIEATGTVVLSSYSLSSGKTKKKDNFGGASLAIVDGINVNTKWISKNWIMLVKLLKNILDCLIIKN